MTIFVLWVRVFDWLLSSSDSDCSFCVLLNLAFLYLLITLTCSVCYSNSDSAFVFVFSLFFILLVIFLFAIFRRALRRAPPLAYVLSERRWRWSDWISHAFSLSLHISEVTARGDLGGAALLFFPAARFDFFS